MRAPLSKHFGRHEMLEGADRGQHIEKRARAHPLGERCEFRGLVWRNVNNAGRRECEELARRVLARYNHEIVRSKVAVHATATASADVSKHKRRVGRQRVCSTAIDEFDGSARSVSGEKRDGLFSIVKQRDLG